MTNNKENVKWVDGFRGIASLLVVLTHLSRAFDLQLFDAADHEGSPPRLVQWPFVRVLFQGRIGVAIFAMLTGYVCALKPIRLCRQGSQDVAFKSMAKSALRRIPRLVLPTFLATTLTWLACILGAFVQAEHCSSWWMRETGPSRPESLAAGVYDLVSNLLLTWTKAANRYDANQWALQPLLQGSMLVYAFMLATGYVQPRYRMMAAVGMSFYYYLANEPTFGMQFFFGVFLSDLQNHPPAKGFLTTHSRLARILSAFFLVLGTYVASFPEGHPDRVAWAAAQERFFAVILPHDADTTRYATSLGVYLIALGLHFSPAMRNVLANRAFLWLGKQSFAVYLLHGPLLRSVFVWVLYGFRWTPNTVGDDGEPINNYTPFPGWPHLCTALVFWFPFNYAAAVAWTTYVDPWCNNMTEKLVSSILQDSNEKTTPLLLA